MFQGWLLGKRYRDSRLRARGFKRAFDLWGTPEKILRRYSDRRIVAGAGVLLRVWAVFGDTGRVVRRKSLRWGGLSGVPGLCTGS